MTEQPSAAATPAAATTTPIEPSLTVSELTVSYGPNRVLDNVDLTLATGEVHALIGPNGAGKTTLVDAITGFVADYEGSVLLGGDPLEQCNARERAARGVRRTFQQTRSFTSLTVGEYLRLAAGRAAEASQASGRIAHVHDMFGLPDQRVPVRLMDVGSRRVLEIAGAVAAAPRVLLLDEPAAGLEAQQTFGLAQRIAALPQEFGCSVLLIEHDMSFVREAARRATVLDEGRVIMTGEVAEVLDDARVIAAYLGKESAK